MPADAARPDAELIALCAEFIALERCIEALSPGGTTPIAGERERDRAGEPITDTQAPLVERICALRVTTLAGHSARGAALAAWAPEFLNVDDGDTWDERLRAAVLRDLSAAGVLPVTAASPLPVAASPPHPDARLVALAAELAYLSRRLDDWEAERSGEAEGEAAHDFGWATMDRTVEIPAITDAGFCAKAAALLIGQQRAPEADAIQELTDGLCRDILAGGGAAA